MQRYLTPSWPAPKNIMACTTLRGTALTQIALPAEPSWLKQVHGKIVVCVDQLTIELPEADASVAFTANKVCAIRTADCLPILICDKAGTQVAAIHAGWRGLAAGIIATTCKQLTSAMSDCLVWLGPAIGPNAFEVGQEVVDAFIGYGWDSKQIALGFTPQPHAKWFANLYYLARIALQQQGVLASNIYGGEWCTFSDPQRFYSYRRSADLGRMVSLIWMK